MILNTFSQALFRFCNLYISGCGKDNHIKSVYKRTLKTGIPPAQKSRTVHEVQQSDEESLQDSEDKDDMCMDMVNIKSISFNSVRSSIIPRLEASSQKKGSNQMHSRHKQRQQSNAYKYI